MREFDGLFVLRTNTRLSALQVVLRYRNLLVVEDTFKTAKALLTTRPIFHKTDAAIRGHIFCSFLAMVLRKELFDRLAARRHKEMEWQSAPSRAERARPCIPSMPREKPRPPPLDRKLAWASSTASFRRQRCASCAPCSQAVGPGLFCVCAQSSATRSRVYSFNASRKAATPLIVKSTQSTRRSTSNQGQRQSAQACREGLPCAAYDVSQAASQGHRGRYYATSTAARVTAKE